MGALKLSSLGRHFRDPNYRALAALKTMSETDENFVRAKSLLIGAVDTVISLANQEEGQSQRS